MTAPPDCKEAVFETDMAVRRDYTMSVFESGMTVRRDYTVPIFEIGMTVRRDCKVSVFETDMTVRCDYTESTIETDTIPEEIKEIEETSNLGNQEIEGNNIAPEAIDREETLESDIQAIDIPIEEKSQDEVNESILDNETPEADTKKEINDTLAIHETSIADELRSNSIQTLADSIALNERFLYSNELFNGNMEAFKRALNELDHIASKADAQRYIELQLQVENNWNMESDAVQSFITLVERRFN